ncbi:unnamed protein product [Lactuca virosa]|uniref:Uncharacterized protein n=1 Tax=Lactuca virosa TaxID=75947 RepID=A0AAU9PFR3_9ASTR|nr:unnamed protein product [Lactuca virosa]
MRTLRSESKMKGNKFSNTFEEAINLDDDDFVNIHSGGSSVVMLSREPLAKKKVKTRFEKGESSVSVSKKKKRKDEHYEDSEADVDVNLTYADKVVLNGYNLRRSRPLIKQIDSVDLEMLEEHGLRNGEFGTLEIRVDGEVDPIDVNGDEDKVEDVESIEKLYSRICEDKEKIEEAIKKRLEEDANDDVVKEWLRKVQNFLMKRMWNM